MLNMSVCFKSGVGSLRELPALAVTDAALLAARVDGTLLVIRSGGTRREHVQRAKDLLAQVNAHLVGAALTHANLDSSVSRYYG